MPLALRHRAALSRWSFWSSFVLAPTVWLLFFGGATVVGSIYLASLAVTLGYHFTLERGFVRADHLLAYSVIASNCWMSVQTRDAAWTCCGILLVVVALYFHGRARVQRRQYDRWHTLWHLACGVAGWCFASGYLG